MEPTARRARGERVAARPRAEREIVVVVRQFAAPLNDAAASAIQRLTHRGLFELIIRVVL